MRKFSWKKTTPKQQKNATVVLRLYRVGIKLLLEDSGRATTWHFAATRKRPLAAPPLQPPTLHAELESGVFFADLADSFQNIPKKCQFWERKKKFRRFVTGEKIFSTGPGSRPPFGESPLGFAVAKFGLAGFKRRPCSGEQGEKKRAGHNCVLVFRYWISASKETTFLSIDHRVLGAFQWEELEFVCDEDWNLRYKGSLVYLGFWTHRNLLFQRKINGKFKKRFHIKHDFCLLGFLESILAKYIFMSHQVTFVSNHTWTTEEKRLKKGYAILGTSPGLTKKNNPAFG